MTEKTARLEMPMLIAGQGQKDVTHNEALMALDCLVGAVVASRQVLTPPQAPELGECWIVAPGAAGEWGGQENRLACWTVGGWRFHRVPEGFALWVVDEQRTIRRTAGGFAEVAPYGPPADGVEISQGGSVIDVEAREALAALLHRLVGLGLVSA
ncbi:DUF2793 domain-containing protein [Sandaracinobacteroides hominis]|uniref:DUF2793 domain-containing protein n=1 Tax=Sandaracinobacteroides hominis TaxID=2780086 RepID=UPI0018F58124|nr:DUF2793 domain-containing protein [Sandaracinobacteroides hominis]